MFFHSHRKLYCLSVLLLALFTSCNHPVSPDYFAYRTTDFTATLEGNIAGRDFQCEVHCRGGDMEKLIFSAPDSLSGLTVTSDKEGLMITKNGLHAEFSPDQLTGLLLPANLLLLENAELRSIQKNPDGLLLVVSVSAVSSPVTVSLTPDGFPSVISCDEISFRIRAICRD